MEILDRKSTDIASLFADLDELLNTIEQTLKNRTPHLCFSLDSFFFRLLFIMHDEQFYTAVFTA